jgi:tRNA U34 5-methylaminomethyl-2-thiouridine-forming methyltransferase MnmC
MKRELRITGDGSHTLYVSELNEPYHSIHGAIQESQHVFIEEGFHQIIHSPLRILEIGLGTGLNLWLTAIESKNRGIEVYYHAVEKYPLQPQEYSALNFEQFSPGTEPGLLKSIHNATWGTEVFLTNHIRIFKEESDFRSMNPPCCFDLVYFDAFAPNKQPELWSESIFNKICNLMNPGAILVTYSARGSVRRTMQACGFRVEKVPGPPGKREMLRARKL